MMHPSEGVALALRDVDIHSATIKLESITLTVPAFSRFALLGPHGAGKTLLVRALSGQADIEAGSGYVLDYPLGDWRIGFASSIGVLNRIDEIPDTPISADSRIARLLALQTPQSRLLILDDPLQGLRGNERQRVIDCIWRVSAGRTLFFTTPNVSDVEDIATHAALIHEGQILTQDTIEAVFSAPNSACYEVVLMGDTTIVYEAIRSLTWIHNIETISEGERTIWNVRLVDGPEAPTRLLRAILADRSLQVVRFNRVRPRIDDFLASLDTAL